MKIIALDCESNGLHGQAFAVAAVLVENSQEVDTFIGRCPIEGSVNPWVEENVLPMIRHIPENYGSYQALCAAYDVWYQANKYGARTVVHVGWPVEARFLLDAHQEAFTGPFPLEDTVNYLGAHGHDHLSEVDYLRRAGIQLPEGSEHDPLFDARVTARVYTHLCSGGR